MFPDICHRLANRIELPVSLTTAANVQAFLDELRDGSLGPIDPTAPVVLDYYHGFYRTDFWRSYDYRSAYPSRRPMGAHSSPYLRRCHELARCVRGTGHTEFRSRVSTWLGFDRVTHPDTSRGMLEDWTRPRLIYYGVQALGVAPDLDPETLSYFTGPWPTSQAVAEARAICHANAADGVHP